MSQESKRFVFKILGACGPGGAWCTLLEQICTSSFPAAYDVGNEEEMESALDKDLRKAREEYIQELFEKKEEFQEKIDEHDQEKKDEAYKDLIAFIRRHCDKCTRIVKNKYIRERVYYQRTGQQAKYEAANKMYLHAPREIEDNLVKQAKVIIKPPEEDFNNYFSEFHVQTFQADSDDRIIEEISEYEARKYYEMWIKIKNNYAAEKQRLSQLRAQGGASHEDLLKMPKILDSNAEQFLEQQKDLLFIQSGQDVEDLFYAFKFYKLTD